MITVRRKIKYKQWRDNLNIKYSIVLIEGKKHIQFCLERLFYLKTNVRTAYTLLRSTIYSS